MEDSESNAQHSKKRAAGVQLTRENNGIDDEETPDQETGTFKRASDDVLAKRRIVKVRRQQATSAASNPFSAIRLVPPPSTAPEKVETKEIGKEKNKETEDRSQEREALSAADTEICEDNAKPSGKTEGSSESGLNSQNEVVANDGNQLGNLESADNVSEQKESCDGSIKSADADHSKNEEAKEESEVVLNDDIEKGNEDLTTEKSKENATFSSFGQLSSSQNAFSGLSGTGFSSSSFSFGSLFKDGSSGSFSFGTSNNGNSSVFATGSNVPSISESSKITPLQVVPVETGEEKEKAVFTADAALFEFIDGAWKERGKGELKLNVGTEESVKPRLIMRTKGNLRLILNASLFPDMKLTSMDKRGVSFACVNSAVEGKDGLSTYALKFRDAATVDSFRVAVTDYKPKISAAPKTPENSPKASSDE